MNSIKKTNMFAVISTICSFVALLLCLFWDMGGTMDDIISIVIIVACLPMIVLWILTLVFLYSERKRNAGIIIFYVTIILELIASLLLMRALKEAAEQPVGLVAISIYLMYAAVFVGLIAIFVMGFYAEHKNKYDATAFVVDLSLLMSFASYFLSIYWDAAQNEDWSAVLYIFIFCSVTYFLIMWVIAFNQLHFGQNLKTATTCFLLAVSLEFVFSLILLKFLLPSENPPQGLTATSVYLFLAGAFVGIVGAIMIIGKTVKKNKAGEEVFENPNSNFSNQPVQNTTFFQQPQQSMQNPYQQQPQQQMQNSYQQPYQPQPQNNPYQQPQPQQMQQPYQQQPQNISKPDNSDPIALLKQYQLLVQQGLMTVEEYETKRRQILGL